MTTTQTPQDANEGTIGAVASTAGLGRMFWVEKFDHPDLVGGIMWADCELAWINERITLAILAEREACAMAYRYSRLLERETMGTKVTVETKIQEAISRPMAYPEIERAVGKQRNPFALGIALTKMVLDGRLHYAFPDKFSAKWPVYSNKPVPKKFQHPKRDVMPPNVAIEGLPAGSPSRMEGSTP